MEALATYDGLGKLLKFGTGIRARRNDEKYWLEWTRLIFVDVSESERGWLHLLTAKCINYKDLHS